MKARVLWWAVEARGSRRGFVVRGCLVSNDVSRISTGPRSKVEGIHALEGMGIPPVARKLKFNERQAVMELLAAVAAVGAVLLALSILLIDRSNPSDAQKLATALYSEEPAELRAFAQKTRSVPPWIYIGYGLAVLFLCGAGFIKYTRGRAADIREEEQANPISLRGCAQVLYALLADRSWQGQVSTEGPSPALVKDPGVRVTVYRVCEGGEALEQVIEYVGESETTGGTGRQFSIHCGLIGLVARLNEASYVQREEKDNSKWQQILVETYGYTPHQVKDLSTDRWAFIAAPLSSDAGEVLGVVFADATDANAFEGLQAAFVASAGGFTAYIKERYQ